jgi:RNA polymerase sigma-70 factor (ECF subfamily)
MSWMLERALRVEAGLTLPPMNRPPAMADSERADVALAQAGDSRAFERLYRTHVNRIHSLVRRMVGGDADTDELVQDVFVRAWQRLGSFRGEAAFGTWLHRLAVNLVLNWVKGAGRGRRLFDDDAVLELRASRGARPDLAMDLEDALAKLPRGARQILVLHDVEGFRHEEIADLLGIASGTSKAQLHRARMLMRGHLER